MCTELIDCVYRIIHNYLKKSSNIVFLIYTKIEFFVSKKLKIMPDVQQMLSPALNANKYITKTR